MLCEIGDTALNPRVNVNIVRIDLLDSDICCSKHKTKHLHCIYF